MRNFAPSMSPSTRTSAPSLSATTRTSAPVIRDVVTVTALPSESRAFLAKPAEQWSWSDLRDYVVTQIEQTHGMFPRNQQKEYGVFSRFHKEYGVQAVAIARYAFEVGGGMWANAPISINRFTKNSDPYFAAPILERLAAAPETVAGW